MKHYTLRPSPLAPISTAKHAADSQCPDGGWQPLTKNQKARLSILARQAAEKQGHSLKSKDLAAFRQEHSIRACGLRISEASQKHWADIKSAFEDLAGRPEAAFSTQLREGDNKRRVALWKLTQALAQRGLAPAYAAAICRTQFKCNLPEASAKQLWALFFTVTNRRKS